MNYEPFRSLTRPTVSILQRVGAKKHPVYGGGQTLLLKILLPRQKGCPPPPPDTGCSSEITNYAYKVPVKTFTAMRTLGLSYVAENTTLF